MHLIHLGKIILLTPKLFLLSKKFARTNLKSIQKKKCQFLESERREATTNDAFLTHVYLQDVARERNEGRPALIFTFIRGLRSSQSIADCIVCSIQSNSITPPVDVDIVCPTVSSSIIFLNDYIPVKILASLSLSLLPRTISSSYGSVFEELYLDIPRSLHSILYKYTNSRHRSEILRIINYIFFGIKYRRIVIKEYYRGEWIGGNVIVRSEWSTRTLLIAWLIGRLNALFNGRIVLDEFQSYSSCGIGR